MHLIDNFLVRRHLLMLTYPSYYYRLWMPSEARRLPHGKTLNSPAGRHLPKLSYNLCICVVFSYIDSRFINLHIFNNKISQRLTLNFAEQKIGEVHFWGALMLVQVKAKHQNGN